MMTTTTINWLFAIGFVLIVIPIATFYTCKLGAYGFARGWFLGQKRNSNNGVNEEEKRKTTSLG